jgi:16S rRNA (guanine527-N7)-methyltransferase
VFAELLLQRFPDLEAGKIAVLAGHWELLRLWNKKLNLTTINDVETAVIRHYCESLFLAMHVPPGVLQIADIGSGPGFPGFPVAVLRPDCTVTLIESHRRKAVFLREASRKLPNIRVAAKRAEDVAGVFDLAVSRAVSYQDLEGSLPRLASRAMLLSGQESPPDSIGFVWEAPVPLPWGERRFLRIGRCFT